MVMPFPILHFGSVMGAVTSVHAAERDASASATSSFSRLQSRLSATPVAVSTPNTSIPAPTTPAPVPVAAPVSQPVVSASDAKPVESTERVRKSGVPLLVPLVPTDPASLAAAPAYIAQPVQSTKRAGEAFPEEVEFLEMRAGDQPAVTIPASRLPRNYSYSAPEASPSLHTPLNDEEALLFFVYEKWRSNWWHINVPFGAYAWQMPFDPMASPWNWDRQCMVSGAMVSAGAMIDYVQRGGLLRFGAHLLMATAFPLTASKVHHPEHREMGFLAAGALNAAVGMYGAVQYFTRPKRPLPWAFFCMFIHTLPSSALHFGRYFEFTNAVKELNPNPVAGAKPVRPQIRIYNAQLLQQYFQHQQRERAKVARKAVGVLAPLGQ